MKKTDYSKVIFNEEINWTGVKIPLSSKAKIELFNNKVNDELGHQIILSDTLTNSEIDSWKTVRDCVAAAEEAVTGYLEIEELDSQLGI